MNYSDYFLNNIKESKIKKFLLVLVVLTVVFASCASPVEEPDINNPFMGIWGQRGTNPDGEYYNILKFTNTQFVYKQHYSNIEDSGPYYYTETTITFDPNEGLDEDDEGLVPWTQCNCWNF